MSIDKSVLSAYGICGQAEAFGNGHINDTYVCRDYIIQKINTGVFKDPEQLMSNIISVTEFIQKKLVKEGRDKDRQTLTFLKTLDCKNCYTDCLGNTYRVCKLIKDTVSYDSVTPELLMRAGYGFGDFQRLLSDYDCSKLKDTIPDFHNTPKRYKALLEAFEKDAFGRAKSVSGEMDFISSCESCLSVLTNVLEKGEIPQRVTHNDTKINNILMDKESGEFVAVIDLDTVMKGTLLYDYGDAIRSGANTAAEDERDLSKVDVNIESVRAFTKGFLTGMSDSVTAYEKELMPISVAVLSLELGIRFLTDYLMGDTYFKTSREGQNLDRARCQLTFAKRVLERLPELQEAVSNCGKDD